jgi:hypothetical protein
MDMLHLAPRSESQVRDIHDIDKDDSGDAPSELDADEPHKPLSKVQRSKSSSSVPVRYTRLIPDPPVEAETGISVARSSEQVGLQVPSCVKPLAHVMLDEDSTP